MVREHRDILNKLKNTDLYVKNHLINEKGDLDEAKKTPPPEPLTSDRQMQAKIDRYENQFLKAQKVY